MELSELKPNALVEHQELGIGRIIGQENSQVIVAFHSKPDQHLSIKTVLHSFGVLPEGGLAAFCYEDPEKVRSWVTGGPLHLVGATLLDLGGSGKSGSMKSRLKAIVSPEVGWDNWWDDVRPAVKDSSHFEVAKSNVVKLLSPVEDIPIEPLTEKESESTESDGSSRMQRAPARRLSEELQSLREAHAADLKQQRESHAAELRQQMDSHAAELKLQRENQAADLSQQRESHAADLEQLRKERTADFKQWQREEDRLNNQLQTLRAEIAANREESRLEIRRDMLDAMAATMAILRQGQGDPAGLLRDAEAGLKLALQAGEAQFYGEVNQLVEYDPDRHESPESLPRGESVTIIHPGVFIPGAKTGNYILLKAQVQRHPEGNR